jgi:hypothetical protein
MLVDGELILTIVEILEIGAKPVGRARIDQLAVSPNFRRCNFAPPSPDSFEIATAKRVSCAPAQSAGIRAPRAPGTSLLVPCCKQAMLREAPEVDAGVSGKGG